MAAHCELSVDTIKRIRRGDIYNYISRYIGGTYVCRRQAKPKSCTRTEDRGLDQAAPRS